MRTVSFCWRLTRVFGLALAACVLAQSRANAQTSTASTYFVGLMGGLAVPRGELSSFTNSGYSLGLTLGRHQPRTPISFRLEGSFTELHLLPPQPTSYKFRIFGIALDGLYNLGHPLSNGGLYLTGGAGYYGSRQAPSFGNDPNWNYGFNGGLGYHLPLNGFTMSFEARYQYVFGSKLNCTAPATSCGVPNIHWPALSLFPITVGMTF